MKKITKENFDKFIKDHTKGYGSNAFLKNIELPKNLKEFKEITKLLYGVKLSVDCRAYPEGSFSNYKYSCQYKIKENQNDYSKGEIYQLWDEKFSQYDGLKVLLNSVFGELFCDGVAGRHYGQTKCDKKTWDRIKNWDSNNDLKNLAGQVEQHNSLVEIFGHNPFIK